jgi:hypothetical protein
MGASIKVHICLGLKSEVEFLLLTKFQDVGVGCPLRMLDRSSQIESWHHQLEDMPKEVVTILGLTCTDKSLAWTSV